MPTTWSEPPVFSIVTAVFSPPSAHFPADRPFHRSNKPIRIGDGTSWTRVRATGSGRHLKQAAALDSRIQPIRLLKIRAWPRTSTTPFVQPRAISLSCSITMTRSHRLPFMRWRPPFGRTRTWTSSTRTATSWTKKGADATRSSSRTGRLSCCCPQIISSTLRCSDGRCSTGSAGSIRHLAAPSTGTSTCASPSTRARSRTCHRSCITGE